MDVYVGAVVATLVAWTSIVVAGLVRIPARALGAIRWGGAASLGALGLMVLGVPMRPVVPIALLLGVSAALLAWSLLAGRQAPAPTRP